MKNLLYIVWIAIIFIIITVFSVKVFGQEIIDAHTIRNDDGTHVYSSVPQYYKLTDGTWDVINRFVYSRQTRTLSGYLYGIWTEDTRLELPDSLNMTLPIKISDRDGNSFAFRPVGFVRYINGDVDVKNIVKFSKVLDGITVSGNSVIYAIGNGSSLKITHNQSIVKQVLEFSKADRTALIKVVPAADYIGIAYEYQKVGTRYKIDVDGGIAWTQDSTIYQVYDITKQYNGNKYWLAGVQWNAFKDTLNHPGAFTIDPAVVDSSMGISGMDGYIMSQNSSGPSTWAKVRDSTNNVNLATTDQINVGTRTTNVGWELIGVYRGFLKFKVPNLTGAILDSAKLILDGNKDYSVNDFIMNLYSAYDSSSSWLSAANGFNKFTGWKKTGVYTRDTLATGLSSANFSTGYNNIFKFTYAGLDTVKAHNNDTLRLALLSDFDVTGDSATANTYVIFDGSVSANKPKLMLYYSTVSLSCSLSVLSTYDSVRAHVYGTDSSLVDSVNIYRIIGNDSIFSEYGGTTFGRTVVHPCSANTKYIMFARWFKGADSGSTNKDTIYTRPDTGKVTIYGATSTSMIVETGKGANNPANTKISIMDSTRARIKEYPLWLTLAGDTSEIERFYTSTQWGTVSATGYSRGQWGIFAVRTQNEDSTYKSAYTIDSLQIDVGFQSLAFTAYDTNHIALSFQADTLATGKWIKSLIYKGTDTTWGDSIAYISTAYKDTFSSLTLNTKYYGRGIICDSSDNMYYSDLDSTRTYAVQPATVTWAWATDTSGVFTATKHGTMPVNSGYFLWDSVRVAAGSTRVYLHPDSLGYFSTKTYRSIASYNDTIKFPKNQLGAGISIKFSLHAGNVDSTGAQ